MYRYLGTMAAPCRPVPLIHTFSAPSPFTEFTEFSKKCAIYIRAFCSTRGQTRAEMHLPCIYPPTPGCLQAVKASHMHRSCSGI